MAREYEVAAGTAVFLEGKQYREGEIVTIDGEAHAREERTWVAAGWVTPKVSRRDTKSARSS